MASATVNGSTAAKLVSELKPAGGSQQLMARSHSTPARPVPSSAASPSSPSSAQPLIDHALFMLSLSARLAGSEEERERAVEMREDAIRLLVLGEEMKRAEELSSAANSPTAPLSPSLSSSPPWTEHLIPQAYQYRCPEPLLPTDSLVPSVPASPVSSAASLPSSSLSRPSSSSSLLLLPSSPSSLLTPDALASSLSTVLTQAELLLSRVHVKYERHLAPLLQEGSEAVRRVAESSEVQRMVEEGRGIVDEWRDFMQSREGEQRMQSLYSLLQAQHLSVTDILRYASDAFAAATAPQPAEAGAAASASALPSSSSFSSSSSSTALTTTAQSESSQSSAAPPFTLSSLPSAIHSFLLSHPELHLFLSRAQSALLSPDEPAAPSASELDAVLASISSRSQELLHSLSATSASLQPDGRPHLLSASLSSAIADATAPVLRILKSPERVFSEGVRLLMLKQRREEVLEGVKQLIIAQLSAALSSFTFPAVSGATSSMAYQVDAFSLSSFHLSADDLLLSTTPTSLSVSVQRVNAATSAVPFQLKQLVFPYLAAAATMDLELRDAGLLLSLRVEPERGRLLLHSLSFSLPHLSFRTANAALSPVYNLLLSLVGGVLKGELERRVNAWSRSKSEELLDTVNEYGGELIRRWWGRGQAEAQDSADKDREAGGEKSEAGEEAKEKDEDAAAAAGEVKGSSVMQQLIKEVQEDSREDARLSAVPVAAATAPPVSAAAVSAVHVSAAVYATPPPRRASSGSSPCTPSSSSPFLQTRTPPILLSFPDTASGW